MIMANYVVLVGLHLIVTITCMYIVDYGNHRVQKFDTNGNYLLQFGSKRASDGSKLIGPYGVTAHNDKEYNNKRISVFQTNGKFCISFGSDQLRRWSQ